jgi:hypothetical protein
MIIFLLPYISKKERREREARNVEEEIISFYTCIAHKI